jgi:uncharacterized protein (TIGR03000 family)
MVPNEEFSMKCLSKLISAALAITLLAGTAMAQADPVEELAKLRLELAATQKTLTEIRQELRKSQTDEAAAKSRLADSVRTGETLRKELQSEQARHGEDVAKLNAAIKQAASGQSDRAAAQAKLAETIKTAETLRKKLESDNAQLITAAVELDLATRAAAQTKAELVVAQKTLSDAKLAKMQVELAVARKTLAETKQALTENQAELTQAAKAREILAKEVAAEKAQAMAAAVQLDLANKEAVRAKAELVATQKTLTDAKQAKTQKELATNQKTLAETRTATDELRRSLEAEIKNSVARLEEANREVDLIRMESKIAAAKLILTSKEDARTKAELNAAQKTLALQPALPATIVVTVPADAQLTFDDQPTTSTRGRRVFLSPPLSVGPIFHYMLKAEVMREGKVVMMQKHIEFRAGDRIEVSLTSPAMESTGQLP